MNTNLKKNITNIISFIEGKKIIISTHSLADVDGIASAFGLKLFLSKILKHSLIDLRFPKCTKYNKQIIKIIESICECKILNTSSNIDFKPDILLITDTNNYNQIRFKELNLKYRDIKSNLIYIDHHRKGNNLKNKPLDKYNIIMDNYTSASEIILDIMRLFNIKLNKCILHLFAAAILTDTGNFKYATNETFSRFNFLLQKGLDYKIILGILKMEVDVSEKIAIIKGSQRSKLIRYGDWLVCKTQVSNYESSVATSLISLGYDIVLVISPSKKSDAFRITARANQKVINKTGIHLGDLFNSISEISLGNGGGHNGAASHVGKKNLDATMKKIFGYFEKRLLEK